MKRVRASNSKHKRKTGLAVKMKLAGARPGRVAEWLARGTHDLLIAGSRLTAATQ